MSQDKFEGKTDRFRGITVTSHEEACPSDQFESKLQISLTDWKQNVNWNYWHSIKQGNVIKIILQGVRGVWFYVGLEQSEWVPVLVKNGFIFHHARPDRVALVKWLPEDQSNQVNEVLVKNILSFKA